MRTKQVKRPLVTVITVTYNIIKDGRKDYLEQNFKSVHEQTYENIEHLVIDGASTDGTLEFLQKYADKGWIRFISEPDKGIFDAMNKGHRNAQGEFTLVLNSDDWYASNTIISEMVELSQKEESDYVYGNQQTVSRNTEKPLYIWKASISSFWETMPFNHPTIMIKNSVVKKMGYYRTDFSTTEDYRFVIQLILEDYKGSYLNKTVVNFRLGGASFAENNSASIVEWQYTRLVKVYHWFYSQFDDRLTEEKIIQNFMYGLGGKFDELFFIRLIRFMLSKKLKNFDYEEFLNHIEYTKASIKNEVVAQYVEKIKFFGLVLLKIVRSGYKLKFYLFGVIPFLTIKRNSK